MAGNHQTILILGGGGMVGQKLAGQIAAGKLDTPVSELLLHDIQEATLPAAEFKVHATTGNIADRSEAERMAAE